MANRSTTLTSLYIKSITQTWANSHKIFQCPNSKMIKIKTHWIFCKIIIVQSRLEWRFKPNSMTRINLAQISSELIILEVCRCEETSHITSVMSARKAALWATTEVLILLTIAISSKRDKLEHLWKELLNNSSIIEMVDKWLAPPTIAEALWMLKMANLSFQIRRLGQAKDK